MNQHFMTNDIFPANSGGIAIRLNLDEFERTYLPRLSAATAKELTNATSSYRQLQGEIATWTQQWAIDALDMMRTGEAPEEGITKCCREFFETALQYWETSGDETGLSLTTGLNYDLLKRAENSCMSDDGQILGLEELCHKLGCSVSTLQKVFRAHIGMSPSRYLLLRRLNAAREEFIKSTPKAGRIAEVAMRHGFWHWGRFSQSYKAQFGEGPKDTIRQKGNTKK